MMQADLSDCQKITPRLRQRRGVICGVYNKEMLFLLFLHVYECFSIESPDTQEYGQYEKT